MFFILDKPTGISSFSFINRFAKENNFKKIGHTGTLDPLATGLLLVAVDDFTRLIPLVNKAEKSYEVTMKMGNSTDTYDSTGQVINSSKKEVNEDFFIKNLLSFKGNISQKPPVFSAIKINGKKSYELARKGEAVELNAREVFIKEIFDIKFNWPIASFKVVVSNGTYIRSLVNDLGEKLGTYAFMTALDRFKINELSRDLIGSAIPLNLLIDANYFSINDYDQLIKIKNGNDIKMDEKDQDNVFLKFKKEYIAFGKIKENNFYPTKVFASIIKKVLKNESN